MKGFAPCNYLFLFILSSKGVKYGIRFHSLSDSKFFSFNINLFGACLSDFTVKK